MTNLSTWHRAVAGGIIEQATGYRGLLRRALCTLVRTHAAGSPAR